MQQVDADFEFDELSTFQLIEFVIGSRPDFEWTWLNLDSNHQNYSCNDRPSTSINNYSNLIQI